jgi:DNA-directed RNA polymerase specialized sigma24 family protein
MKLLRAEIILLIERKIYLNAKNSHIMGVDFEDLCQELRIKIYPKIDEIVEKCDKERNPAGYIATLVKWRITDLYRKYSKSEDVYHHCTVASLFDGE